MASYYAKSDLVQLIRDEINEPTARIFADAQLNYFIDMGAKACSALSLCVETDESENLVENQYEYTPSTNYVRIESVHIVAEDVTGDPPYGLQRIHPQAYGNITTPTTGQPLYFFEHWNTGTYSLAQIYILPAPNSTWAGAASANTLRIHGYSCVEWYESDASTQLLPHGIQTAPLHYALSCVYARLGKHRLSALNMQKFIDECNRWRYDVFGAIGRVDSYDLTRIPDVVVTPQ